ncbi:serine hydrolase domain-containing protein [Terrabacter sp. BE26]|uniref:serine hydrolase domain-containing protein n=1 Tax=Terrabacter sp. BE26 TaxID=2898152 RepID=UPI0035BE62DF
MGSTLEVGLQHAVRAVLERWPTAGLAVAVVRPGGPASFECHGVADVTTGSPVTPDTVFRVGSLTKTFTAVAVLQLCEQGRLDLDAPANRYLSTFRLRPARPDLQSATVRDLLTHTAGIGFWRRPTDLLHPVSGAGVETRQARPLGEYYRGGLPQEVRPGTKWVYSNHGFAALGQLVEDVSGQRLRDYLRQHVLDPLGMEHTDLDQSERVSDGLATGYVLRRRGLVPVAVRDVPTPGGGGLYSTSADLARYVACLLDGGSGPQGRLLQASSVAQLFAPHYQPDPRLPGMGLAFELRSEDGRRVAVKDGVVSGFLSALAIAPSAGTGVIALANTGGLSGRGAPVEVVTAVLRELLGLARDPVRHDVPPRPEVWGQLCGWYSLPPGAVTNLFARTLIGAGAEVVVDRRRLVLKALSPVPVLRRGVPLLPDDPKDPYAFRVDFSATGRGTLPVVFTVDQTQRVRRLWLDLMGFDKRPGARNPRLVLAGGLTTGALAAGVARTRRRRR